MSLFEDIAFNLIELGHSPEAIMGYEITFLLGYAIKKIKRNKAQKPAQNDDWTTSGNKRSKTVTSNQMLQKARAKKDR